MNLIQQVEQDALAKLDKSIPDFRAGDTLKVHVKVKEGTRERVQIFEGVCIGRHNNSIGSSFTVRKLSFGEGVERVFPLYSPVLEKIECVRKGDVRRAKLYYLRGLTGKAARITEKNMFTKKADKAEVVAEAPAAKAEAKAPEAAAE